MTLTDIVQVVGTSGAFAALRSNGRVVAWGLKNPDRGANVPVDVNQVRAIYSGTQSFAALSDLAAYAVWGEKNQGGSVPDDVHLELYFGLSYEATPESRARYRQIEEMEQMRRRVLDQKRDIVGTEADEKQDRQRVKVNVLEQDKDAPLVIVDVEIASR